MADYIDRQALDVVAFTDRDGTFSDGIQWLLEYIDTLPSADVQSVQHGHWEEENSRPASWAFYCSECKRTAYDPQPHRMKGFVKRCRYAYCPNCGARMDGEQND